MKQALVTISALLAAGIGVVAVFVFFFGLVALIAGSIVYGVSHGLTYVFPAIAALSFKKSVILGLVISGVRMLFTRNK